MADTFKLAVLTPDQVLLDKEVAEVILPGVEGSFGVLAGHTTFITQLAPGVMRYREGSGSFQQFVLDTGLAKVDENSASVLVKGAYSPTEIDEQITRQEMEEADKQIEELDPFGDAYGEWKLRYQLAEAKLDALNV